MSNDTYFEMKTWKMEVWRRKEMETMVEVREKGGRERNKLSYTKLYLHDN